MSFTALRQEVHWVNVFLPRAGLVSMHSGNASSIDRESGIISIKPSGVDYDRLRPQDLVAIRLDGHRAAAAEIPNGPESPLNPSVDTPHHLGLYRADSALGGVVHTHSNHATAFAVPKRSIPCALTAIADEFGSDIPCAPYVDNQGDNIVRAILAHRGRGPAVLLGRHGVLKFDRPPAARLRPRLWWRMKPARCSLPGDSGSRSLCVQWKSPNGGTATISPTASPPLQVLNCRRLPVNVPVPQ